MLDQPIGKADKSWVVRGPVLQTQNSEAKYFRARDMGVRYPEWAYLSVQIENNFLQRIIVLNKNLGAQN